MNILSRRTPARGFTLIELLVVIAIIGLLSSVVLASLNTARAKGRNAQRLTEIHQYQTALELYASDNSGYPQITPSCLGHYSGSCWNGSYTESATLNGALAKYISSGAIPADISPYNGFLYINCPYSGVCTQTGYAILWFLEGVNQKCGAGSVFQDASNLGETYCIITN